MSAMYCAILRTTLSRERGEGEERGTLGREGGREEGRKGGRDGGGREGRREGGREARKSKRLR